MTQVHCPTHGAQKAHRCGDRVKCAKCNLAAVRKWRDANPEKYAALNRKNKQASRARQQARRAAARSNSPSPNARTAIAPSGRQAAGAVSHFTTHGGTHGHLLPVS